VVISFVFLWFGKKREKFEDSKNDAIMALYHSHNCGHCVSFMPIWEKFRDINKQMTIKTINCDTNECPNVKYFPTIIMEKNGKNVEYSGNRTLDDLQKFVSS
jgi:thiol-disulfide isomerase/thioredoxin